MNDGLTLPLTICDPSGTLLGAFLMNAKAFNKSIERRELWIVHPSTSRVLPLEGVGFSELRDAGGLGYAASLNASQVETFRKTPPPFFSLTSAESVPEQMKVSTSKESVLEEVAAIISRRRVEMPEGSYTTHLFQKGVEKIRKKTGEEAIELLLAKTKEEIVYETADLIYHTLVLLEVTDVRVGEVLDELKKRMK